MKRRSRWWGDSRTNEDLEGNRTPALRGGRGTLATDSYSPLPQQIHFPKTREVQSFGALPSLSIALGNHVKTHMVGAYSDKPNNAYAGYHVNLHKPHKNVLVQIPPPSKAKFIQDSKLLSSSMKANGATANAGLYLQIKN